LVDVTPDVPPDIPVKRKISRSKEANQPTETVGRFSGQSNGNADSSVWSCLRCTLENPIDADRCEVSIFLKTKVLKLC